MFLCLLFTSTCIVPFFIIIQFFFKIIIKILLSIIKFFFFNKIFLDIFIKFIKFIIYQFIATVIFRCIIKLSRFIIKGIWFIIGSHIWHILNINKKVFLVDH